MNTIIRFNRTSIKNLVSRFYCVKKGIIPTAEQISSSQFQEENGHIYDKKPFKIKLDEGKIYSWCLCGKSKSQPLCDGTHKNVHLKLKLKPVRFKVQAEGDYWLCNCKHTKNRPFCDGTHKKL